MKNNIRHSLLNVIATLLILIVSNYAQALSEGSKFERSLSLFDLGVTEKITLNELGFEKHFHIPLPKYVNLDSVKVEVKGKYFQPFADRSNLSFLINGETQYSQSLSKIKEQGVEGNSNATGIDFHFSFSLKDVQSKKGFIDLGILRSSQLDATHCFDTRGRGEEIIIDPKATVLTYTIGAGDIRNVNTLIAALPRLTWILLPSNELSTPQYNVALKVSHSLNINGIKTRFIAVPKPGEEVTTDGIDSNIDWSSIPFSDEIKLAVTNKTKLKLKQKSDVQAWIMARLLSRGGLANVVIDSKQTGQAIVDALDVIPPSVSKKNPELINFWPSSNNLAADKVNIAVGKIIKQPVLFVENDKGAMLIASQWQELANTAKAEVVAAEKTTANPDQHVHIFKELPYQIVSSGEWQFPLRLADLPDGKWPDQIELNLLATPTADGQLPSVSVMLNDKLIKTASVRTDGEITKISASIPSYAILANNILKIQINRHLEGGHCTYPGQIAPVQLLPTSYLTLRKAPDPSSFFMMQPLLSNNGEIAVPKRYLAHSSETLPLVTSILSGLALTASNFSIAPIEGTQFDPDHPFVAFEVQPKNTSASTIYSANNLIVKNDTGQNVLNLNGVADIAVVQLANLRPHPGILVSTSDNYFLTGSERLNFGEGNFATIDANGERLQVNLAASDNHQLLDEQNISHGFLSNFTIWALVIASVFVLFGLAYYIRRK